VNTQAEQDGERTRLVHTIARMRACLVAIEKALSTRTFMSPDAAQAVTTTAFEIAMQLTRLDAFRQVDRSGEEGT
jgi:hypothetical protein